MELKQRGCVGYFPFVAPNLPAASLHPALCSSRLTVLGLQQRASLPADLQMSPDHRGQEQGMGTGTELETGASVAQLPPCCGLIWAEALLPPAVSAPLLQPQSYLAALSPLRVLSLWVIHSDSSLQVQVPKAPLVASPRGHHHPLWVSINPAKTLCKWDSSRTCGRVPSAGLWPWHKGLGLEQCNVKLLTSAQAKMRVGKSQEGVSGVQGYF